MTDAPRSFPRIKPKTIYGVRACDWGGGRPHWHVTSLDRDIIADNGQFTFATEASATKEAERMNRWVNRDAA